MHWISLLLIALTAGVFLLLLSGKLQNYRKVQPEAL